MVVHAIAAHSAAWGWVNPGVYVTHMTRFRLSIAQTLAAVAVLGVALAALRSPTQLWAGACLCLALASLTLSTLAAVYRRGPKRAFWVGFSACGWAYLVFHLAPWFDEHVGPHLATTAALDLLYDRLQPGAVLGPRFPVFAYGPSGGHKSITSRSDAYHNWTGEEWNNQPYLETDRTLIVSSVRYRRIGHSLFALMTACAGGLITARMSG